MRGLVLICCFLLTHCAIQQKPVPIDQSNANYVKKIQQWGISGAIAAKKGTEGWQARVTWQESSANTFSGRLYAYLTSEQVLIDGKPGQVKLTDGKGYQAEDTSIERLLKRSTGWHIPMDQMRYWIRGIAAPQSPAKSHYNRDGLLGRLEQAGWEVVYKDYIALSGYTLPRKMELTHADVRLRLVISKWTL